MTKQFTGYKDMNGKPIHYGDKAVFLGELYEVDKNDFGGYPVIDNDFGQAKLADNHFLIEVVDECELCHKRPVVNTGIHDDTIYAVCDECDTLTE